MPNSYMYAIERSNDYLAHYGIKGMRWGVQKALKRGNMSAYKRQYRKATKKLERLEKRANNGYRYAQKAIIGGTKVAATGGFALAGITNPQILAYRAGMAGYNAYRASTTKRAAEKAKAWRDEMEKTFDPGQIYTPILKKRHRKHGGVNS